MELKYTITNSTIQINGAINIIKYLGCNALKKTFIIFIVLTDIKIVMSDFTIDDAIHFVESNASFFTTPLDNQSAFRAHFEEDDNLDAITDYSTRFITILKKTLHQTGQYVAPVWQLWVDKKFKTALEHPEVQQFIMKNTHHSALLSWQSAHPPKPVPKQKTVYTRDERKSLSKSMKTIDQVFNAAVEDLKLILSILQMYKSHLHSTTINIYRVKECINTMNLQLKKLARISRHIKKSTTPPNIAEVRQCLRTIHWSVKDSLNERLRNEDQEIVVRNWAQGYVKKLDDCFVFNRRITSPSQNVSHNQRRINNTMNAAMVAIETESSNRLSNRH